MVGSVQIRSILPVYLFPQGMSITAKHRNCVICANLKFACAEAAKVEALALGGEAALPPKKPALSVQAIQKAEETL